MLSDGRAYFILRMPLGGLGCEILRWPNEYSWAIWAVCAIEASSFEDQNTLYMPMSLALFM
jgi:hypothetical protein